MSLRFRYVRVPTRNPVWPLGGRTDRPKALIHVSVVGPTNAVARLSLLDTGADDTVFPEAVASVIGLDLTNAPSGEALGVSGVPVVVRYAQVELRLTDGLEYRFWQAWVAFSSLPLRYPLLGYAGCLQFFDATFLGASEEVVLATNALYPGK